MSNRDLEEFGHSIGVEGLQLGDSDCLKFVIENVGELFIQRRNECLLFYILKSFKDGLNKLYWDLFTLAHRNDRYAFLFHPVAFLDNQVGFAVTLAEKDCDLPTIHKIYGFLVERIKSLKDYDQ
jgi:hypothetical protein